MVLRPHREIGVVAKTSRYAARIFLHFDDLARPRQSIRDSLDSVPPLIPPYALQMVERLS